MLMRGIIMERTQSDSTRKTWSHAHGMLDDWRVLVVLGVISLVAYAVLAHLITSTLAVPT